MPLSANELTARLGLKSKTGAFKRAIKELLDDGLIQYTLPDNIQSRLQKYRISESRSGPGDRPQG
jgi:ATP-dependent DNA helicase RecG